MANTNYTRVITGENKELEIIVSDAENIRAIYGSMFRASGIKTKLQPQFLEFPKFNPEKLYGVLIYYEENNFCVINTDTIVDITIMADYKGGE